MLLSVERRVEVDRVGVIDRGPVDDAERVAERRPIGVLVKRAFNRAVHEASEVAVALGEISIVLRCGHEFGVIDRVARGCDALHHVVPRGSQFVLGLS